MQVWLKGYQCQRCRHQWKPRKKGTPLKCPSCDSPYWQQPRREAGTARKEQSNGEDQDALLDLVEIPEDYRKRQEPMIKGKGTPVWALVSDSITGGLTPEEVSKFWGGYVTPEEVRAAIAYWRKYPESVDYKLNEE
jgi:uncharacterized protein (DUF433 family)/DNA-directed RNA polymerase subunit RPC12/RpoP